MTRKATNKLLQKAKEAKSDEFYTQVSDIERELQYYEDQFKGKVVYCNCDDPRTSGFFKFFSSNFKKFGLKEIISSCYKKQEGNLFNPTEFEGGFFYRYSGDTSEKREPTLDDVTYFNGDWDFRSPESIELLLESDVVVTNPPFSLFREYVQQLVKYNKKFLIIGNINAITYKEIFKLIQEDKVRLGIHLGRGISWFIVPEHYELYGTETYINDFWQRIISPNNCLWLTNLENFQRDENLPLTKSYFWNEINYPRYDNYDGINVNKTKDIPYDYSGTMGVPITFLHKYNPKQFEIIKFRKGDDERDLSINGVCPYFRILIKNKHIAW